MFSFTLISLISACISSPVAPEDTQATQDLTIQVSPTSVWLTVGGDQELRAWIPGMDDQAESITYSWTSSDPDIVEVGSDGVLHARKNGSVSIGVRADKPGKRLGQQDDAVAVTVTDVSQASSIDRILGVTGIGERWSLLPFTQTYDRVFAEWGDNHWDRSGGQWEFTYYDRALAWYAAWQRTGDVRYLERGHQDAVAYRDNYVLPNDGKVTPKWVFPEGLAIHYLLTDDPASAEAIALMAQAMSNAGWLDNMLTTPYQDGRIQGRSVLAQLVAREVNAPPLLDWDAELSRGIENLVGWYEASGSDGSWEMELYCGGQANFQVSHALLEVLIRYHDLVDPDARIPEIVRNSLDYMWTKWDASSEAFPYNTVDCSVGGTGPAPDLNLLIVWPFGWYYQLTGNDVYRQRGDDIFESGLQNTYFSGYKQFNQSFMRSWRYPHVTN